MPFSFDSLVAEYRDTWAEWGNYPRYQGWDTLWRHVQSVGGAPGMATPEHIEKSALHLAFYLAVWGMFRGSGALGTMNLDFYKELLQHVVDEIPLEFWGLTLDDFDPDSVASFEQARDLLREANYAFTTFNADELSWTPTLFTKMLLGLWGACPALDRYVRDGIRDFNANHHETVGPFTYLVADTLASLCVVARAQGWQLEGWTSPDGALAYPKGKVIDMAFWQHGWNLRQ